ncbi:MAG: tail fiber domain-containing protein, partial [Flavobacteriales bacterium]
ITPANNVLDQIKGVEVMRYTFKADASHTPQLGYIAQNLEEHFPEFVNKPDTTSGKESNYTVNYAGMSAVAIKAIQEQQEMIVSLQQALTKVQARLDQLEK